MLNWNFIRRCMVGGAHPAISLDVALEVSDDPVIRRDQQADDENGCNSDRDQCRRWITFYLTDRKNRGDRADADHDDEEGPNAKADEKEADLARGR